MLVPMNAPPWPMTLMLMLWGCLAGCAVHPSKPSPDVQMQEQARVSEHIQAADKAQQQGQPERAMAQLEAAIDIDPANKWPWIKKAQWQLAARQYGAAIASAQEALQRDAKDPSAQDILALSGLRVSLLALSPSQPANEWSPAVRAEAEDLLKLVRDALGEASGVSPVLRADAGSRGKAQPARTATRAFNQPAPAVAGGKAGAANGAGVSPVPPNAAVRGNPFGALQ